MKRLVCPEGQIDIFPQEVMAQLYAHQKPDAPLPPLPFERNQEVSAERACRILGIEEGTLRRLLKAGLIRNYRVGKGSLAKRRIEHASLVEFCDAVRRKYLIKPRRATSGGRPRDEDILPFPLRYTMSTTEAAKHLDVKSETITELIDSGDIIGYRLHDTGPFRIYRPSFAAYVERLRGQVLTPSARLPQTANLP